MFHKAINVQFLENTVLEVTFTDGVIMRYDVASLFQKYPQLKQLENRSLFEKGKLVSGYGIIWNDELDIETDFILYFFNI